MREERGFPRRQYANTAAPPANSAFGRLQRGSPQRPTNDRHRRCRCGRARAEYLDPPNEHDYEQRLKAFFLFAEVRGWCRADLAAGIMAPRFRADESVPKWLRREDVLRLLTSVNGDRPVDKRDRAILDAVGHLRAASRELPACDWTIWTGKTRCSSSAARSPIGPIFGRCHTKAAMPSCAKYGRRCYGSRQRLLRRDRPARWAG